MKPDSTSPAKGDYLHRLVRRDLVWNPGPAEGGGGTAQEHSPSPDIPWWQDGDLLLVIVERNDGPEVSCVRVHADGDMLDFSNAATGDFDFGWTDRDISWWARLDGILPTNAKVRNPHPEKS
jgi:hypothetical protein